MCSFIDSSKILLYYIYLKMGGWGGGAVWLRHGGSVIAMLHTSLYGLIVNISHSKTPGHWFDEFFELF